jgi:serine/threonine protein kinase
MDYYTGGTLFFHLRKSRKFSEKRARFYAAQLLCAMGHLHESNIAYRDLKLENILMDDKGYVALTDFGLSKENVEVPDGAKTFCGTAEYIAPELLKGLPYGKPVDWWGFGTLLFEMITGQVCTKLCIGSI